MKTYVIVLYRTDEEDNPEAHGSELSGVEQVAAELQEANDLTGLPVGRWKVVEV